MEATGSPTSSSARTGSPRPVSTLTRLWRTSGRTRRLRRARPTGSPSSRDKFISASCQRVAPWHTRRRDSLSTIFLLRHRESGSRRSRLRSRPAKRPGLLEPGAFSRSRDPRNRTIDPKEQAMNGTILSENNPAAAAEREAETDRAKQAADEHIGELRRRIDELDDTLL